MITTLPSPVATSIASQSLSLFGALSPMSTDLWWVAPLAFAAAVWIVVLVAIVPANDAPGGDAAAGEIDFRNAA